MKEPKGDIIRSKHLKILLINKQEYVVSVYMRCLSTLVHTTGCKEKA
jgi:hypothetical protein